MRLESKITHNVVKDVQILRPHSVTPRPIMTFSDPGTLRVTRNAIGFVMVSSVVSSQLNLMLAIFDALQNSIVYHETYPYKDSGEVEISIPWRVITAHHDPKRILQTILPLMDLKLTYMSLFEGAEASGVVNLISSAEYRGGAYYIRIPGRALPWYLYCGRKVGFILAERHVFYGLGLAHEKKLYLILSSKLDTTSEQGFWRPTVDDLRNAIGLPHNITPYRILSRILLPFVQHLTDLGSQYTVQFQRIMKAGHVGRPSIIGIHFWIYRTRNTVINQCISEAISLLSKCRGIWHRTGHESIMDLGEIERRLGDDGLARLNARISQATKRMKTDQMTDNHLANLVAKILREDYETDVFRVTN